MKRKFSGKIEVTMVYNGCCEDVDGGVCGGDELVVVFPSLDYVDVKVIDEFKLIVEYVKNYAWLKLF